MKGGIVMGMPRTSMEEYATETRGEAVETAEEIKENTQEEE